MSMQINKPVPASFTSDAFGQKYVLEVHTYRGLKASDGLRTRNNCPELGVIRLKFSKRIRNTAEATRDNRMEAAISVQSAQMTTGIWARWIPRKLIGYLALLTSRLLNLMSCRRNVTQCSRFLSQEAPDDTARKYRKESDSNATKLNCTI